MFAIYLRLFFLAYLFAAIWNEFTAVSRLHCLSWCPLFPSWMDSSSGGSDTLLSMTGMEVCLISAHIWILWCKSYTSRTHRLPRSHHFRVISHHLHLLTQVARLHPTSQARLPASPLWMPRAKQPGCSPSPTPWSFSQPGRSSCFGVWLCPSTYHCSTGGLKARSNCAEWLRVPDLWLYLIIWPMCANHRHQCFCSVAHPDFFPSGPEHVWWEGTPQILSSVIPFQVKHHDLTCSFSDHSILVAPPLSSWSIFFRSYYKQSQYPPNSRHRIHFHPTDEKKPLHIKDIKVNA